ncbi:MAG: class I mannose-6-phosphate isomerase [Gemmataceae bacterium]|nr:class I mannose-6-phosphate isomerase [Gemmataceae bacterium]MCI0740256.1 class I mannose-6-phosphate isomerase [Gemmataceae bacterium]
MSDGALKEPLVFEPFLRPMVWGGRALGDQLGKRLPTPDAFGESWELSAHPLHVSVVAEGHERGRSLTELCALYGDALWGAQEKEIDQFPWLIKFLDCQERLSIQVHPDDALARKLLNEPNGKTEAWVVLHAEPSAKIYAGFHPGITRGDVERHLQEGTLEQCLASFTPRSGVCVFLPAGTVHAVGGGVLLAEVQQSSDATFRLYDWNRLGTDGKPRTLHIEQALSAIDWQADPVQPITPQPLPDFDGQGTAQRLVACPYFELDHIHLKDAWDCSTEDRLAVFLNVDGHAQCGTPGGFTRPLRRGETIVMPAALQKVIWNADAACGCSLLRIRLPG